MEIPLDEAVAGDVLAREVVGADGVIMLASGAELTGHSIALLRERGITAVSVVREGPPEIPDSERVDAAIGELERMFSDVGSDPIMKDIYEVARAMLERARAHG